MLSTRWIVVHTHGGMLFNIWNLEFVLQFPIDLDQYDRREQLKKSGLGKVCIFS